MKNKLNNDLNSATKEYVFQLLRGGWFLVATNDSDCIGILFSLLDFFAKYEINIPEYITYCLIETDDYNMKFREYGNKIHIYVTKN